jgi:rhodanese-related sulfurtransferase/glyoxylase-like metal-dependent hydrolase (beta-lactamase superfamily II)
MLKQFRQEGCLSYLVWDGQAGEALVIDPRTDLMDEYREYLAERKLKPVTVVDTRLHWHHLSASHLFAEAYGIPVAMGQATDSKRVTRKLATGDKLRAGRWELDVIETPGVATDAICLVASNVSVAAASFGGNRASALFCGDTIQIGAGARTDLPGASVPELWQTLHHRLAHLVPDTIVFPGFDRPGYLFSTLAQERARNPDWLAASVDELARLKAEEPSARGEGDLKRRLDYNRSTEPADNSEAHFGSGMPPSPSSRANEGVAAINAEKYSLKLKRREPGILYVDVREPEEYASGHIPGTVNFPLSELSFHLPELKAAKRVYLSCRIGRRSRLAARTLDYLGFGDVVDVSGGIQAWQNAGLPVSEG